MDSVLRFRKSLLLLFLAAVSVARAGSPEANATVVVYNSADPVSASLAKYYAQRREIPDANLVGLSAPILPEITRAEYRSTIAIPLMTTFETKGWWSMTSNRVTQTKIRYVVLMKGMPLKIKSDGQTVVPRTDLPPEIGKRDEASVDSEVACLGMTMVPTAGIVPNPYHRRFTPVLDLITDPGLLLVCRLDAPNEATVRAMIDAALATERDGLWGWAYVDSGWATGKAPGYADGDKWLTAAATQMREKGIPVLWDKAPESLPAGYPVTDAAIYYGWYAESINGPFQSQLFRFRTGAVAVHIHSFSAASLSDANAGWSAPLLERGAAATLGNVYEPYLALTANLDVFQDRLMSGFTFAESAYCSMRVLSWMNVAIGDPLYRPYAAWRNLQSPKEKSIWQRYRDIVLVANGNVVAASKQLSAAAKETRNSMFLESLAAAQADANDLAASLDSVEKALAMDNPPLVRFRLILEKLGIMQATKRLDEVKFLLLTERPKAPGASQAVLLDEIQNRIFPPPPTPTPASSPKLPKK